MESVVATVWRFSRRPNLLRCFWNTEHGGMLCPEPYLNTCTVNRHFSVDTFPRRVDSHVSKRKLCQQSREEEQRADFSKDLYMTRLLAEIHQDFEEPAGEDDTARDPCPDKERMENDCGAENSGAARVPRAVADKFTVYKDEDSQVICDVDEERLQRLAKYEAGTVDLQQEKEDEFSGMNLQRGKTAVFDLEDLVDVLRMENAEDICAVSVPKEFKYVDYMVIMTGKSPRQMKSIAEFIRKLFKRKRSQHDQIPRIEGRNCSDWIALDLGNIALHIFSREARLQYDLETLWCVGSRFDEKMTVPEDPLDTLLEQHTVYLQDLQPLETS